MNSPIIKVELLYVECMQTARQQLDMYVQFVHLYFCFMCYREEKRKQTKYCSLVLMICGNGSDFKETKRDQPVNVIQCNIFHYKSMQVVFCILIKEEDWPTNSFCLPTAGSQCKLHACDQIIHLILDIITASSALL